MNNPDPTDKVVIIGDDSPQLVRSLTMALRKCRLRVIPALSADEAENKVVEVAETLGRPPALVVSDVYMPGRTGLELTKALRATFPEMPVLLMSAFASDALRSRAEAAGATDLIAKPFDLRVFRERVLALAA